MCKWLLFAGDGWHLFTSEVVFQWSEQMPDDGDAPGPAQEPLSGTATHVGHVCVVDREAKDPLQLSAPKYVLFPVHQHREVLILPLFDGVGAGSDGAHLPKLCNSAVILSLIHI